MTYRPKPQIINPQPNPQESKLRFWQKRFLMLKANNATKTNKQYTSVINLFINFVGEDHWPPTMWDLTAFFDSIDTRVSLTTKNSYWRVLQTWFNVIQSCGGFGSEPNPVDHMKTFNQVPKKPFTKPKGYHKSDIDKLFAYLKKLDFTDDIRHLRDLTLLYLLYRTGMRSGEAANLRREDLNLEERHILLDHRTTKTSADRDIYFGPGVADLLKQWIVALDRTGYNGPWIFPQTKVSYGHVFFLPDPIRTKGIYRIVRKRLDEAGLPMNTVHAFRHTFTKEVIREQKPLSSIQRQLGHSSPVMVLHYAGVWREDQKHDFTDWG